MDGWYLGGDGGGDEVGVVWGWWCGVGSTWVVLHHAGIWLIGRWAVLDVSSAGLHADVWNEHADERKMGEDGSRLT